MPSHHRSRPLKTWRYLGLFGPEVMLCLAQIRIGRARQTFWAVWDRRERRLYERRRLGRAGLRFATGSALLRERDLRLALRFTEVAGVEAVSRSGQSYAWTRKQGAVPVSGTIQIADRVLDVGGAAIIDDTAAYYPRHTRWRWCAGVGRSADGRNLAWNLVSGVNDPPHLSERTLWVDGVPQEVGPCSFSDQLTMIDQLRFAPEAVLEHRQNLLLLRSDYRQPFGTFSGRLPGGIELAEGYGVTEEHDAWW